jgi:hypothetical protein
MEQEKIRFFSKNVEKVQDGLAGSACEGFNRREGTLPERRRARRKNLYPFGKYAILKPIGGISNGDFSSCGYAE